MVGAVLVLLVFGLTTGVFDVVVIGTGVVLGEGEGLGLGEGLGDGEGLGVCDGLVGSGLTVTFKVEVVGTPAELVHVKT
jgi:hypothetical protein